MENPGRAARGVEQRIEERPVGDRVGAVEHGLGLAIRARNRTRVEVVAADDDGSGELAVGDHLIERKSQAMSLPQAHPADARRQALELNARAGHVQPMVQVGIVRNQLPDLRIGLVDILRITRQRRPAERSDAAAEERANVLGHEARNVEGALSTPSFLAICRRLLP